MRLTLAITTFLTAASLASGDTPKAADAEKVAAAGEEAMRKVDWKAYAVQLHPDTLKAFRDTIVPSLQAAEKADKADKELLRIFGGAKDVKTVLDWKPEEFFVKTMTALTSMPATKAMFTSKGKSEVIGTVFEGKDQAHVVVRATAKIDTFEMKYVGVVTLKLHGGKWKLLADYLVKRLADGVKQTCELHVREK